MLKHKSSYFLENLFFIACLFPFVSLYPLSTGIQPWAGFFALLIIFKKITMSKMELLLLCLSLLFALYINPLYGFSTVRLGLMLMLPYGIVVFVACRRSLKYFSVQIFNWVVLIYLLTVILTLLFPQTMIKLQSLIVSKVNVDNLLGIRGVSVFSNEPGLLAGVLIAFLLINSYFYSIGKLSKKYYYFNFFMIIFMLISTKSGTFVLFFAIYLLLGFKWNCKRIIFTLIMILLISYSIYLSFDYMYENFYIFRHDRAAMIFYNLLYNPSLLLEDTSILTRVYSFFIGIISIVHYPFGRGANGLSDLMSHIIAQHAFLFNFPGFQKCLEINSSCSTNSSLSNILMAYGILGLFFICLMYTKLSEKVSFRCKVISFMFLSASYSAAFPMIWLLLCLKTNYVRGNCEAQNKIVKNGNNKCMESS